MEKIQSKVKRGEIYYYDFGKKDGSVQSGTRPVMVIQCDEGNQRSQTTIVAPITTSIKKRYMPSHVVLGENYGLRGNSMVLLEQIATVNQDDLDVYVGIVDDDDTIRRINNGLKKALGLWIYTPTPSTEIHCLCKKCLNDYIHISDYIVKRLNPFSNTKEKCDKCDGLGYDYLIQERKYPVKIMEVKKDE